MPGLISSAKAARSELAGAISSCRGAFLGIALMTGMLNVLYLTGSFFMLEIYDRVLPSRSIPTLVGLAVLALVLYAFQGILDIVRGRVLVRIGASLDQESELAGCMMSSYANRSKRAQQMVCNRCATSTRSERSSRGRARHRSSICPGCRSISASAFSSIPGSGSLPHSVP